MAESKKIGIYVVTHKRYTFPDLDFYSPLHVGRRGNQALGYLGDDTGENISHKNTKFCELTGIYWVWKNAIEENSYIGFVHYRRYFKGKRFLFKGKKILTENEILQIFKTSDIILPVKRKYYIETVYNHYKNAHFEKDLIRTKSIVADLYPDYLESFDEVMTGNSLYLCNMFIMKKEHFDRYMKWLFSILDELEKSLNTRSYDSYQSRVFGFIGERLFNVWIEQSDLQKQEIKVVNLEGEKYFKKVAGLLKRKLKL